VSAPNSSFDPKQVSALGEDAVNQMVAAALVDIDGAADLAALKEVRLAHAGDRSPLALANREIGALPPAAKVEVGKRVGEARARIKEALTSREEVLQRQRDEEVLVA
jgi:phenylalanyl-tRNA synthetase alpha chain